MPAAQLSIAIVGGGPAGISLAWHLSWLGFDDVTILESSDALGGQSLTIDVDGVPVELGTCYLSAGYRMARDLAERMGCHVDLLPPATVVDGSGQPVERDDPPAWLIARYIGRWLPWYLRGQMQRPHAPDNAERFDAWLRARRLRRLATDFTFQAGLTAQLYGPLDRVSAHSALTWIRPSLFVTGRLSKTYVVREGFQTFWRRLAGACNARVELGRAVRAVEEGGAVVFADGSRRRFDRVFVTAPLDRISTPLSPLVAASGPFEDSPVYSGIWRATDWPAFAPSRCYLPACRTGEPGRLLTARRFTEVGGRAVGQMCAYGRPGATLAGHREQAAADLREILGLRSVEVLHDRLWRYNIRYSPEQLAADLPRRIDDAQGQGGIWYSGGTLSHWNIDSITDFNHGLVGRFARANGAPLRARLRRLRLDRWARDL